MLPLRKILALTINEWIKISRKTSILVIIILMVVGVFGLGGIIKLTVRPQDEVRYVEDNSWLEQATKDALAQQESRLKDVEARLAKAGDADKPALESERSYLKSEIEVYKIALEQDINLFSGENYLQDLLRERQKLLSERADLAKVPAAELTPDQAKRIKAIDDLTVRYDKILKGHDFADYIALLNERIQADATLSKEEKDIRTNTNKLWLKLDPAGEDAEGKVYKGIRQSLRQIENMQRSLADNLDHTGSYGGVVPLSPQRRDDVANELAVLRYKLENGLSTQYQTPAPGDIATSSMVGIGMFMTSLLMSILAGSAISSEISTGSIKSLIISPARRWKIYLAKLIALATTGALLGVLLYIVAMVAQGVFFGFGSGASYIYASSGIARELGFYSYQLARLAVNFVDVATYTMMAYMLSIITRNTAVSVGLSIAVYFSSNIIRAFLTLFEGKEWVRFIPFVNLSLAGRMFPFDTSSQSLGGFLTGTINVSAGIPLGFSVVYLAVLLFCMGYIGLDSFNRRDIK